MSSELPPGCLGLRNDFEIRSDDWEEEKEGEKNPGESGDAMPPGAEDETELPKADDEPGRVFLISDLQADFSYRVPVGDESEPQLVLYQDESAQNLGEFNMTVAPELNATSYDKYKVHLPLHGIAAKFPEPEARFFIVLDKSEAFGSFALGVFAVASDEYDQSHRNETIKREIDAKPALKGGITDKDYESPWAFDGITPGKESSSDGDRSSDPATGGGGLSDGAKAGIGAGVGVAGLLLIGLAIFFFLRYKRRKRAATTDKSLTPANDYMRDKEINAGQVAETPHSPASDDDNLPRDGAVVPAADDSPPANRSSAVATPTSVQREVPTSVAHLVEEGMTDEEIRRLEEEERALDQAIEQAGRR